MGYFDKLEIFDSPTTIDATDLREARSLQHAEKRSWNRWEKIEKRFWNNGHKLWRPVVKNLRPFSRSGFYKNKWQLKTAVFEINLENYRKPRAESVSRSRGERRQRYQRSGLDHWREWEQEALIKYMINLLEKRKPKYLQAFMWAAPAAKMLINHFKNAIRDGMREKRKANRNTVPVYKVIGHDDDGYPLTLHDVIAAPFSAKISDQVLRLLAAQHMYADSRRERGGARPLKTDVLERNGEIKRGHVHRIPRKESHWMKLRFTHDDQLPGDTGSGQSRASGKIERIHVRMDDVIPRYYLENGFIQLPC